MSLSTEMKEPENYHHGRGKHAETTTTEDNNIITDNNNVFNNNNNNNRMSPRPENRNSFETSTKREERRRTEGSNPSEPKSPDSNPGTGIYFVSFGKTTEPFNFGSGKETSGRDEEEELVRFS